MDQGGRVEREALTLRAPAKLNLTLEVMQRLPSGYHDIRSVMTRLRHLADVVRVEVREDGNAISIRTNSRQIPVDATNICHRAAGAYLHDAGVTAQVDIDIRKAIPVAAGLGGGSAVGAAVLTAINRHFENRVPADRLSAIGSGIGKDLPFFLNAAMTARASGMGETVRAIAPLPPLQFLIVNPGIAVSTKAAYEALRDSLWFMERTERADRTQAMVRAIEARNVAAIAASLYNDFEIVAERLHPVVKEIKQSLLALGARGALMSGSGPTVFGLFDSTQKREIAADVLGQHYPSFGIYRG